MPVGDFFVKTTVCTWGFWEKYVRVNKVDLFSRCTSLLIMFMYLLYCLFFFALLFLICYSFCFPFLKPSLHKRHAFYFSFQMKF